MPLKINEFGSWTNYSKGNIYYPNSKKEKEPDYEVCSICRGILIKIRLPGHKVPAQLCSLCGLPAPTVKKTQNIKL